MSTDQNATQAAVEAANDAMYELLFAKGQFYFNDDVEEKLRAIWQPVADALCASVAPEDFEREHPALAAYADWLGPDYVGITSDTRAVVRRSLPRVLPGTYAQWNEFVIDTVPDGAIAWKYGDPTEPGRWVYDEADASAIAAEDPSLLVRIGAA